MHHAADLIRSAAQPIAPTSRLTAWLSALFRPASPAPWRREGMTEEEWLDWWMVR